MRHTEPNTSGVDGKIVDVGRILDYCAIGFPPLGKTEARSSNELFWSLEQRLINRGFPGLIIGTVIDYRSG